MKQIKENSTYIVLLITLTLSLVEFLAVRAAVDSNGIRITKLTEVFALTAIAFLYATVITFPLKTLIPALEQRSHFLQLRKGIAIAAVYFITLHVILAFFTQLGGFAGLSFLNQRYLSAIIIGFVALVVSIAVMVMETVGKRLRRLQNRLVSWFGYALLLLISLHALMLGNHFVNIWAFIPQLFISALAILLVLQALCVDQWLRHRIKLHLQLGPVVLVSLCFISIFITLLSVAPTGSTLNVHNDHGGAADNTQLPVPMPSIPAGNEITKVFQGYTVTLTQPGGGKQLAMELTRTDGSQPSQIGQGKILLVNQTTYDYFSVDGTVQPQNGKLNFNFSLDNPNYVPGVYKIYATFYLATGGLVADFNISLE